jgi:hypothetical protein
MKLFKQRLARRSNAVDGVSGRFWESRFLSVPLLDNGAVFGCMAYVDRNPMRARMVTDPADALFTSIAHRLCAVGSGRAASFFHEDDGRLGARLTPLSACYPVDPVTGGFSNAAVTLDEYRALVVPGALSPTTRTVCQGLGIDATAWRTAIGEGGLFQGVAVGNRTARVSFAYFILYLRRPHPAPPARDEEQRPARRLPHRRRRLRAGHGVLLSLHQLRR